MENVVIDGEGTPAYEVNSPRVLGETVEGETVLIDSRNGAYYSLNESGSQIWSALRSGPGTAGTIGAALAAHYQIEIDAGTEAAATLLTSLSEYELVRSADRGGVATPTLESLGDRPVAFTPPTLERFDDLEDLLLLDPIHDVDPERGWPIARADG
jgi:hypothetical protein